MLSHIKLLMVILTIAETSLATDRIDLLVEQNLLSAISRQMPGAKRICQELIEYRDIYSHQTILARLNALVGQLDKLYPGPDELNDYRFPDEVDGQTRDLVRNMLNLYRLTQVSAEHCVLSGTERERKHRYNFHELHQILMQQLGSSSANMAQFIENYYREQLAICRTHLSDQFRARVLRYLRPTTHDLVTKVMDDMIFSFSNVNRLAAIKPIEQIDRGTLVSGVIAYCKRSNPRDYLADSAVKLGSLKTTLKLRFEHHCGAFFIDPFRTLAQTYELADGQQQELIREEHGNWLRCYKICQQAQSKLTDDDWTKITEIVEVWLGHVMQQAQSSDQLFKTRVNRRTFRSRNLSHVTRAQYSTDTSNSVTYPLSMGFGETSRTKKRIKISQDTQPRLITQEQANDERNVLDRIRANVNGQLNGESYKQNQSNLTDKPNDN